MVKPLINDLWTFLLKRKWLIFLLLIILIGIFFRTYQLVGRMGYGHDADLFSWIVKDIVVNHHFRLIGQLTSADGIFIGPFYYYLLVPFFLLTGMDPVAAAIPITIIGILTVISYYWVFASLFDRVVGLIASFFVAVLIDLVYFDRWVVPSTPTNLWTIWYFYTVIQIARGQYSVFPVLGILTGLIWHIHIALLPALLAILAALIAARKIPSIKQVCMFFAALIITSIPLILFETRHHFSQTVSLINNFSTFHGGGTGLEKLNLILIKFSSSLESLFFRPQTVPLLDTRLLLVLIMASSFILVRKKILSAKELTVLFTWVIGVILFYTFSSTIISEYYFTNLHIIFIGIVSMCLSLLLKSSRTAKYLVLFLLLIIGMKNIYYFVSIDVYHKGYVERKAVAEYITNDARQNNYPCVAVNYITSPGENVGFRYFFWLNKLHVNQPMSGSPVYNIVIPSEYAQEPVKFGNIGVIPPTEYKSAETIQKSCSGLDSNLTDSLFGYTE